MVLFRNASMSDSIFSDVSPTFLRRFQSVSPTSGAAFSDSGRLPDTPVYAAGPPTNNTKYAP